MCRFLLISSLLLVIVLSVESRRLPRSANVTSPEASSAKVICYHESWDYYRTGHGKFSVTQIDPSLCTHIVYAYLTIENAKIKITDPWLMKDLKDLKKFVDHRSNAKAFVAIGGIAPDIWSDMASDANGRATFVDSVMAFLKEYHFNGVMLDWTYPQEQDKEHFVALLDKFDEKMAGTTFSMAITGGTTKAIIEDGYDVKKIVGYVDFIRVLSYDFHGPWEKHTGHAAPLHQEDNEEELPESGAGAMKFWASLGAPKDKLVLSIPLMARTWRLESASDNGVGAAATGAGAAGPDSKTAGYYTYAELCRAMKEHTSEWKVVDDKKLVAAYATRDTFWASYDDPATTEIKSKWVKDEGFGGVAVYAWGSDDFRGDCGEKFPIIKAMNKGLGRL